MEVVFDQPRRLMENDDECARREPVVLSGDVVVVTRRVKNDLSSPQSAIRARADQAYGCPSWTRGPDEVGRSSESLFRHDNLQGLRFLHPAFSGVHGLEDHK